MNTAPPFSNLASIKQAVRDVAKEGDIPTTTYPSTQPAEGVLAATMPVEKVTPLKREKPMRKSVRAEEGKLSVLVPVYLLEAIDKKRSRSKTKRFIVLQAFKDAGYEVREADFMEDGRRGRE